MKMMKRFNKGSCRVRSLCTVEAGHGRLTTWSVPHYLTVRLGIVAEADQDPEADPADPEADP